MDSRFKALTRGASTSTGVTMTVQGLHDDFTVCKTTMQDLRDDFTVCKKAVQDLQTAAKCVK